jgi:hypothetical protein
MKAVIITLVAQEYLLQSGRPPQPDDTSIATNYRCVSAGAFQASDAGALLF